MLSAITSAAEMVEGEELLEHAASLRLEDVRRVAEQIPTAINQKDHRGRTVLAILAGATEAELSTKGSSLEDKRTLIAQMIRWGANPATADNCGMTALHHAVEADDELTVSLLMTHGADPTVPDESRFNALHIAATRGHEGVVRLLAATPQVQELGEAKNKADMTPLMIAAGQGNCTIVRILLPLASWLNIREAVRCACEWTGSIPVVEMIFAWTQQRLSQWPGATQQQDAESFRFPLTYAVYAGKTEMLKLFLRFNCLVSIEGTYRGDRAIHFAVEHLQLETVKVLVDAGADMAARTTAGKNIFHLLATAAQRISAYNRPESELEVARYLVGVERLPIHLLNQEVWVGRLGRVGPVFLAVCEGRRELAGVLADAGGRLTENQVRDILQEPHFGELDFLTQTYYPYLEELVKESGSAIAHYAAMMDESLKVLKACVGFDCITAKEPGFLVDGAFFTPICVAVKKGSVETVRFLVGVEAVRAQINDPAGPEGETPLLYAFGALNQSKRAVIANLLLEAGADPTHRLDWGETVMEYVKRVYGRVSVFKDTIKWMEALATMDERVLVIHKLRAVRDGRDVPACLRGRGRRGLEMPEVDLHGPVRKTRRGGHRKIGMMETEWRVLCDVTTEMCSDMHNELMAYMTPSWVVAQEVEAGEDENEYIVIDA